MKAYDPKKIEGKWQKIWEEKKQYETHDESKKPKYYALIEFPYPSGDGLHVGHPRPYIALDIVARKRRAEGFNVLYPIGWDAFGLPTENYAIKTGIHPKEVTKKNTDIFRKQIKSLGISFDWSREINTSDPAYYKWTQWIFLQFFKKGLAYKMEMPVNWCLSCKIGLANEEVVDGRCERCGGETEKHLKKQWMLAITKYAEKLLNNLKDIDYLPEIKTQQAHWIGKKEGLTVDFPLVEEKNGVSIFTTRPDTIFGVTYIVLAPEHSLIQTLKSRIKNFKEVESYQKKVLKKTEIERINEEKEKTGVRLEGITAKNPINGRILPIFIADYVLSHYGTGALMAVPAHDERDYQFAKKYDLPIREVIVPNIVDKRNPPFPGKKMVERNNVHAVVKDPKTGKYLALKWNKFDWVTFPMGGVEEEEDPVSAARREVKEETGFINLKLVRVLEGQVRAEYFASHKDENRTSYTTAVIFELSDHEQISISEKEKEDHEIIWLHESQLNYENMTHAEVGYWNEKLASSHGAFTREGILINSGNFTGFSSEEARKKISDWVEKEKWGERRTQYKLRDWVFSRQRYWGEPIPIIHCEKCGEVAVPEKDLPVELPDIKNYKPNKKGESPLLACLEWVNISCPACGGKAHRETDVMPNWAGSSWYFLRYIDPRNDSFFADKKKLSHWMPVDWYNGGMEHTTLHLLYSRFWNLFLYDAGYVPNPEPYKKRTAHGLILAEGGVKMSKSKGNVVNPDEIVNQFGADTLRVYEMFMGPFNQVIAWNTQDISGSRKFLEKVWDYIQSFVSEKERAYTDIHIPLLHKTLKKISSDIESMAFNTAVSSMMIYTNTIRKTRDEEKKFISREELETFLIFLAPFAPHIGEELWHALGNGGSINESVWPETNEKYLEGGIVSIAIQVKGKLRGVVQVKAHASEEDVLEEALKKATISKWISKKEAIKKIIYIEGKVLNIII